MAQSIAQSLGTLNRAFLNQAVSSKFSPRMAESPNLEDTSHEKNTAPRMTRWPDDTMTR